MAYSSDHASWHTIANMFPMIKILNYKQIITQGIQGYLSAGAKQYSAGKGKISGFQDNERDLDCCATQSLATDIDHTYDELWENTSRALPVACPRDSGYLQWRYLNNPVFRYEIIEERGTNGRLEGYAVIGCQDRNRIKIGLLVDILYRPGREDIGLRLIESSVRRLKAHNALIVCALAGKRYTVGRLLSQTGFWKFPKLFSARRVNLVGSMLESTTDIQETIFDFNNWYLTLGDTDNA